MAGAIAHVSLINGFSDSLAVAITSTTAGNTLIVCVMNGGKETVTATATGATFANKLDYSTSSQTFDVIRAYNISAGITTVTLTNASGGYMLGNIYEVSGVGSSSDPWDTINKLENGASVTNLGTGTITTGSTGTGIAIAHFSDQTGDTTNITNGTGWTAGAFGNGLYYEYRASSASTGYGGANSQATASGTGNVVGIIFNLFDAGVSTLSINVADCFDARLLFGR
jgi:hypothetical protein